MCWGESGPLRGLESDGRDGHGLMHGWGGAQRLCVSANVDRADRE